MKLPKTWHPDVSTQCTGKRKHRSHSAAIAELTKRHRVKRTVNHLRLNAYRCPHCTYWHIGNSPRFDRLKMRPYERQRDYDITE